MVLIKQRLPCRALLRFLSALSFWSAIAFQFAGYSTTRLPSSRFGSLRRRKAFLLCKNPCGGTAVGMGSPPQSGIAAPAQRNFQRKFALRRVGSSKFVVPPTRERSKVRNNARLVTCPCRAAPGCQRDRGPLFREASRGTPSKGFLWATSSRRLDTALLCAAKKRGVETYQAGRTLPVNPRSSDHGSSKKATCCGAGSIPKNMQKPQKPCSCKYIPLVLYCG